MSDIRLAIDVAIAALVALRERLDASVPVVEWIDQDSAEARVGLTRRAFLDASRRDAFPVLCVGKKRRAKLLDVEGWLAKRRTVRASLATSPTAANDDAVLARAAARFARPRKNGLRVAP